MKKLKTINLLIFIFFGLIPFWLDFPNLMIDFLGNNFYLKSVFWCIFAIFSTISFIPYLMHKNIVNNLRLSYFFINVFIVLFLIFSVIVSLGFILHNYDSIIWGSRESLIGYIGYFFINILLFIFDKCAAYKNKRLISE